MISNKRHDVGAGAAGAERSKRVSLADFDGQRLAVVVRNGQREVVMQGTATFVRDTAVGNSLRIHFGGDEPGDPVLMLSEDEWHGRIVPDFHHGCDFCLMID